MENNQKQTLFEKKIKPILLYIGTIGASLMVIAYISIVLVMIFGFKVRSFSQSLIFATINGIVGFVIMQLLKIQGIDFAKSLKENQDILKQYYQKETKERKFKSIKSYWISSVIKDVLGKVVTIVLTSCCLIYIVVEGSNDYSMLLLAFVNLIMFVCFGLLSLVSAYDFYNNEHIPYIQDQLAQIQSDCNGSFDKQNEGNKVLTQNELDQSLNAETMDINRETGE